MTLAPFRCIYCSSEDTEHPFDFLFRNDIVSGWISGPNPQYPIDAVIDLKGNFILTGLEIASHQSMIAQRVDLYGTKNEKLDQSTVWESIGFFTFNSNQRSQWQAREIKRIKIDNNRFRYLRMNFQECYSTPPNYYYQVSIISLEIQGRIDIKPRLTTIEEMISDLQSAKQSAVDSEDYGAAADYKEQLDNISSHHDEIVDLLAKKAEALKNEQYLQVDSLIRQIMHLISPSYLFEDNEEPIIETYPEPQPEIAQAVQPEENEQPVSDPTSFFLTEFKDDSKVIAPTSEDTTNNTDNDNANLPEEQEPQVEIPPIETTETTESKSPRKSQPPSIRKVPLSPKKLPKKKDPINQERKIGQKRHVPDFSNDQPKTDEPDQLSDENRAIAEPLIELFGEPVVAMAFSNGWSCKVNGYQQLCELIKGLKTQQEQVAVFKDMLPLIKSRFADGLKSVYCSAIENTISLVDAIELSGQDFNVFMHAIFPNVINKLGDSNQRIDDAAHTFAIWACTKDKYAFQEVIQYASKAPQPNQYHLWIAKLTLLKVLIEKYGIGKGGKLNVNDVMNLIAPCLQSRKAEVRQQAFELVLQIQPILGDQMDKSLTNMPRLVRKEFTNSISRASQNK